MVAIQVVRPGETRTRFMRRPNFPIAGTMKPFALYPIMLHPVLPGETLKSAVTKWSVVSRPVVHPLAGAWLESWLFYVKLTDIDTDLAAMFISDGISQTSWEATSYAEPLFAADGQIKWPKLIINKIRDAYFINEGESAVGIIVDGGSVALPQGKLNMQSWYQNLMFEPAEVALDVTGPRDAAEQIRAWEMIQQMQMTELTYAKYLEQYGVRSPETIIGAPEILRYSRSWTKPINHIDPTSGAPSSAWVWNDEMKVDKDKRFSEPGFLVMVAMVRPKMFNKNTPHPMVCNLWGISDFFPAYQLADPSAGIKNIGTTDLVFDTGWNASESDLPLLVDSRDLLSHGEQFINDVSDNPFAIPYSNGMDGQAAADPSKTRGEYCSLADVDALFSVQTAESDKRCYYEGIVQLTISGHVTDTTL